MSASIFGSLATQRSHGSWTDQDSIGQSSASKAKPPIRTPIESRDAALIAILEAPLLSGETAHAGFARKERELGNEFAALSVLEARSMQSRLSNPRAGDALAQAFSRMTSERRARLINFLADARRREALAR